MSADVYASSSHLTSSASGAGDRAIVAQGLQLVYATPAETVQVLKGVDLQVRRGAVHIIMGPSGSGKTTLLLLLAGLLTPTAGQVCLLGCTLQQLSRHQLEQFRLQHVGFVSEEFNLFSALTALENVAIALTLKGVAAHQAEKEALDWLAQVGLADHAHQLPRSLSGGQQQRVAIARAIAGRPTIVMADEPTSALDSQTGHLVMQVLHQLAHEHGCTVCMTTHDPRTLEYADRVDALEDGQLTPQAEFRISGDDSAAIASST